MSNYVIEKRDNEFHEITSDDIKRLWDDNERELEEGKQITQTSFQANPLNDWSRQNFYDEMLVNDPKTNGFIIHHLHGTIIEQSMNRSFFRGENRIFSRSIPSLLRAIKKRNYLTMEEIELYRLVSDMRIAEFKALLDKFRHVQTWNHGTVLYESLAQHYGLETNWLDITNDFKVALFFASCYFDGKEWRPLTRARTEENSNTQYGVLFHVPSKIASRAMGFATTLHEDFLDGKPRPFLNNENVIYPIGFQPFMRCSMQSGYGIYMRKELPLQEDPSFEKLVFHHSESLSEKVFEAMDGGKKIYPHEGLLKADFLIEQIRNLTSFSEDSFEYALKRNHYYKVSERSKCLKDLLSFRIDGSEIKIKGNSSWRITNGRRDKKKKKYVHFSLEKDYGIEARTRRASSCRERLYAPWMLAENEISKGVFDMEAREINGYSILTRYMIQLLATVERGELSDF